MKVYGKDVAEFFLYSQKRMALETFAEMHVAYSVSLKRIFDMKCNISNYEKALYDFYFFNRKRRLELRNYRFGTTFEHTLELNAGLVQLYEQHPHGIVLGGYNARRRLRR